MTQTFWLTAAVMIVLALAFIIAPLFFHRSGRRAELDLRNQNLLAYRSRMEELDREFESGAMDEDSYRQLREELAGSMLDDVPDAERGVLESPAQVSNGKSSVAVVVASLVIIPAAAVFLYQQWGALDDVEQFRAMEEMMAADGDRLGQMQALTAQLRERLEESPDNTEGWAMLGRTYMRLEQFSDAAWAFERLAGSIEGDDSGKAVAWGLSAQAQFFLSQGELTPQVTETIEKARALNPDEVNALGLLGIYAFGQENYEEALQYWERIVEVAPDHPQIGSIRQGIEQAYQRLGREAPAEQAEVASGPGVTVRVEIAEAFRGEVPEDTTLFVLARSTEGQGGPPLAVARLTAGQLPADVRLDDRFNMSPDNKLSDADEVRVQARLSRAGTARPQAGDWQGQLDEPVPVSDGEADPVTLVIDKQLVQ
ncbi:c-type cytochrome biogenesis protein CcmI [Marinobacter vulgaris]|uniref:C-type cytochrome biogenesis protein CcmI n=1 Tax=Marinobacter vulgaris TaxID=1928331 RepID=A0A2V3ZKQ2_9GAMM|nr:c-type cytochrome biogenesis protein CcmI [Marinobacter vulgaris]PXX90988.1 c-type cytochrome biogenesis protein CcmI [Marinobacter vulgaris]TSJ70029.1 c-type cytochrome biogenesis protein CcmI [Marinobacter vulgaris]